MARVKRAVHSKKHRRATLERAKGYYGNKSRSYRAANEQVMHSLQYAYRDRRARKGDFDTKTRKVEEFLEEGHKVKITIMFRGREVAHPELGMKILDQVAAHNADLAKVEAAPKLDGRNMVMVLAPDKRVQAEAARRKALEAEDAKAAAARAAANAGDGADLAARRTSPGTADGAGSPTSATPVSADAAEQRPTGAVGEENP